MRCARRWRRSWRVEVWRNRDSEGQSPGGIAKPQKYGETAEGVGAWVGKLQDTNTRKDEGVRGVHGYSAFPARRVDQLEALNRGGIANSRKNGETAEGAGRGWVGGWVNCRTRKHERPTFTGLTAS